MLCHYSSYKWWAQLHIRIAMLCHYSSYKWWAQLLGSSVTKGGHSFIYGLPCSVITAVTNGGHSFLVHQLQMVGTASYTDLPCSVIIKYCLLAGHMLISIVIIVLILLVTILIKSTPICIVYIFRGVALPVYAQFQITMINYVK